MRAGSRSQQRAAGFHIVIMYHNDNLGAEAGGGEGGVEGGEGVLEEPAEGGLVGRVAGPDVQQLRVCCE